MKSFLRIFIAVMLSLTMAWGQVAVKYNINGQLTEPTVLKIPTGKSVVFESGSTLTNNSTTFTNNGTFTNGGNATFSKGVLVGAATGGMPGTGIINAQGLKINGVDVGTSSSSYWAADAPGIKYTAGPVSLLGTPTGGAGDFQAHILTASHMAGSLGSAIDSRAPVQGIVMNGVNGAVVSGIPNAGTTDFTFAAWVVSNDTGKNQSVCDTVGAGSSFQLRFISNNAVYWYSNNTAIIYIAPASSPLVRGKMQFWTVTRTAGTTTLYVDGDSKATAADTQNITLGINLLGSDANGTENLNGFVRPFVYNRALSASEVASLYETTRPEPQDHGTLGNPASMTALYTSDFSAGVDSWGGAGGTASGNNDGINGVDDALKFYADGTTGVHQVWRNIGFSLLAGRRYRVSGQIYVPTGQTHVNGAIMYWNGNGPVSGTSWMPLPRDLASYSFPDNAAWQNINFEFECYNSYTQIGVFQTSAGNTSFTGANSASDDRIYLKNIAITPIGLLWAPDSAQAGLGGNWKDVSGNGVSTTLGTGNAWAVPSSGYTTFATGNVTVPSINFNDPNTGFYAYTADHIGVASNGASSLIFGGSGYLYGPGGINNIGMRTTGAIELNAGGTSQNIVLKPSATTGSVAMSVATASDMASLYRVMSFSNTDNNTVVAIGATATGGAVQTYNGDFTINALSRNTTIGTSGTLLTAGGNMSVTGNLGVGTTAPAAQLELSSNSLTQARIVAANATSYYRGDLDFRRSRGTVASPTVVQGGDYLGSITFTGYNSGWGNPAASFYAYTDGTPGATYTPSGFLWATATNSVGIAEKMRLTSAGNLSVTGGVTSVGGAGAFTINNAGANQVSLLAQNTAGSSEFGTFASGVGYLGTTSADNFELYAHNTKAVTLGAAGAVTVAGNFTASGTGSHTFRGQIISNVTQSPATVGSFATTVTPSTYADGSATSHGYGLVSASSAGNHGAVTNVGLYQTTANADDMTAGVYLGVSGWYQNSGLGVPVYIGGGYTSSTSPALKIVPENSVGGGIVTVAGGLTVRGSTGALSFPATTTAGGFHVGGGDASVALVNSGASAGSRIWDITAGASSLNVRSINDAYDSATNLLSVSRTGSTTITGNLTVNGTSNSTFSGPVNQNISQDTAEPEFGRLFNAGATTAGRISNFLVGKTDAHGGAGRFGYKSDTDTPANARIMLYHYGDSPTTALTIAKSTGNVGVAGNLTVSGTGEHTFSGPVAAPGVYASIYVEGASAAQTLTTGGTYYKLTAFTTDGPSANCTAEAASDRITVTKTGTYMINMGVSFAGTANATMVFKIYKNGSAVPGLTFRRKLGSGGDVGRGAITGLAALTAADVLDVRCTSTSNNDSITCEDIILTVMRVGS